MHGRFYLSIELGIATGMFQSMNWENMEGEAGQSAKRAISPCFCSRDYDLRQALILLQG
jgi:hypothetical protein